MTKQVLFIHGGGEGSYAEDKALADFLRTTLDSEYALTYPKFMGLENLNYATWKEQVGSELNHLDAGGIIVAHSLGGAALLKYLSEESHELNISGLFLIALPYKVTDGEWGTDDFALDVDFYARIPKTSQIFLYHSRDDEWVPFLHLNRWADKILDAVVRPMDERGHSFTKVDFVELVNDIQSL